LIFKKDSNPDEHPPSENSNLKSFKCPRCGHIIVLDENQRQQKILRCPICGQDNMLNASLDSMEKKQAISYFDSLLSQLDRNAVIIGTILLLFGLITLYIATPVSYKINLTIIIIGVIISSFVVDKQQDVSLKIVVGVILFILFLYLLTGTDVEMFLILIFIGVSIVKLLLDEYLPSVLKMRMNLFLTVFFFIFMILVIKRIINVVNI
jgi:hypothetical protein